MDVHLNDEAERLAIQLASRTGLSITEAVNTALRETLARLPDTPRRSVDERLAEIMEISRRSAALPVLDARDHAQMLYDENGLPA